MLKLTLEVYPHGKHSERTTVLNLEVWNHQSGTGTHGNYRYSIHRFEHQELAEVITGTLQGFRRNQPAGAIQLVQRILRKEFPFVPEDRYLGLSANTR